MKLNPDIIPDAAVIQEEKTFNVTLYHFIALVCRATNTPGSSVESTLMQIANRYGENLKVTQTEYETLLTAGMIKKVN